MLIRTRDGACDEIETKDLSQSDEVDFVLDLQFADLDKLIRIHDVPHHFHAKYSVVIVV